MRVFFLDLWLDLREKRLAPVAILLLAGIIAVPIVLAKGADTPPPPDTTTTAAAPGAAVVESEAQEGAVDSKLQTFSPRDPFEPTGAAAAAPATTTTETGGGDTTTGATGGDTGATAGGDAGTGTGTGTAGGGVTGTGPGTGTGTGTGDTGGTGGTTQERRTEVFTYTVDLRFGQSDGVESYRNVRRLELIPDEDDPKIVFLGVTTTGKTAVFLVDGSIEVDSPEGRCRPSRDECTFLYLRPDADHDQATLTDPDGTVYRLRLQDINRVSVSSSDGGSGNSGSGNGNTRSDRAPAFTGKAKSNDETVPGDSPPGEPGSASTFQQFFADSSG